jgi:hypothetical protein
MVKAGSSAPVLDSFSGENVPGTGTAVITASQATQYALQGDSIEGSPAQSIFTRALVEGLKTGAADVNTDGHVSLDELFDYLVDNATTESQEPELNVVGRTGQILIAKNPHPAIRPADLPAAVQQDLLSDLWWQRKGAVDALASYLEIGEPSLALAARLALERMVDDPDKRVSSLAASALAEVPEMGVTEWMGARAEQEAEARAEQEERDAKARAEQDAKAREEQEERDAKARAEQDAKAREEQKERDAKARAEQDAKARAEQKERDARARAEQDAKARAEQKERDAKARAEQRERKVRMLIGIGIVGALVAILIVAFIVSRDGPPPESSSISFVDDFSTERHGWDDSGDTGTGGRYEGGTYLISAERGGGRVIASPDAAASAANFRIKVDAHRTGGTSSEGYGYGVFCRADASGNLYAFTIWAKHAVISKRIDGRAPINLGENSDITSAVQGDTKKELQAVCVTVEGQRAVDLQFWVNGEMILSHRDEVDPLESGTFGLQAALGQRAGDSTDTLEVEFDNFEVREE